MGAGKVLLIHFRKLQVLWDVTLEWWFPTFRNISDANFAKTGTVTAILYLGVSIYMRTFHTYWPSLVKFGLGDCQIIPRCSLIVSFMKIGRQKAELHAWACLKSCHFFNIFVTIRIKFCMGYVHKIFLVFNEFHANRRSEIYPLVRGLSKLLSVLPTCNVRFRLNSALEVST